jgi:hypothetical protein
LALRTSHTETNNIMLNINSGMYDKTKSQAWYKRLESAGLTGGNGSGSLFMR